MGAMIKEEDMPITSSPAAQAHWPRRAWGGNAEVPRAAGARPSMHRTQGQGSWPHPVRQRAPGRQLRT